MTLLDELSRGRVPRGGKTERGRLTRTKIVSAASELFCQRGYLDTTMGAIATAAGVSVQTLYVSFGSKVAILAAAHDVAVVGDSEPVPVLERPWVVEAREEPDGRRALELVMANTLSIIERTSPLARVIQSGAADAEVAELLRKVNLQRLTTLRELASALAAKEGFHSGLSMERAADILYATVSDELYRILVIQRHWPTKDWREWAYDGAAFRMFPQPLNRSAAN